MAKRWDLLTQAGVSSERMMLADEGCYVLAADYERDVAAAEERGWNAAVEACRQATAGVPLHVGSSYVRTWQLEAWADIDDAIAALRKDTGREVGG